MRTRTLALIALGALLALPAPAARADAYHEILSVYEADGSIPPCRFSSPELEAALRGEDAYGAQYFADFTQAIQAALERRAAGQCLAHKRGAIARGASAAAPLPPLPRSPTSATDAPVPWPMLLLGGLALAGVGAAALAVLQRSLGWTPKWAARARHGWAEAGYRAGGWAQGLADAARAVRRRRAVP